MKPPAPVTKAARANAIPRTVGSVDQPSDTGPGGKLRADFHVDKFVQLLKQKGYPIVWRKALLCPCLDLNTAQPALNCAECDSSGWLYIDPIEILSVMSGFEKRDSLYKHPGHWMEGNVSVTVEPQYRLGYHDSLEMQHSVMVFAEYIFKGDRRGSKSLLPEGVDSGRYRIVHMVTAMTRDGDKNVRLEEGLHFVVEKGLIQWTTKGHAVVADGAVVTLNYEFHPVWIVTSHPKVLRDTLSMRKSAVETARAMPINAIAQLEYLFRSSSPASSAFPATGGL